MSIKRFLAAKKGMPWQYRIKVINQELPTQWSNYLVSRNDGFVESYTGPIALSNIEYIEINPFEVRFMGRGEQDKRFDHTAEILDLLFDLDMSCLIVRQNVRVDSMINYK